MNEKINPKLFWGIVPAAAALVGMLWAFGIVAYFGILAVIIVASLMLSAPGQALGARPAPSMAPASRQLRVRRTTSVA